LRNAGDLDKPEKISEDARSFQNGPPFFPKFHEIQLKRKYQNLPHFPLKFQQR
jgi:hypothetical protein